MMTWSIGTRTRPFTRRAELAAGGLAAGVLMLAACGPQAPSPSATGGSDPGAPLEKRKPVKLDFWGDPASDERKDQINAWNQKYPNLQVTFGTAKTTGQGVDAVAAITAAAAAGTPPHVVDFDRFQVNSFAVRKVFQPLDDFIKRDKYDMNRFAPLVLPEAQGIVDRKTYGLLRSTDDRLLYWNKELFQQVGLDPEKAPATWDELKQFAIRLTKQGGPNGFEHLGFHTEQGQSHYHIFAWQNGGGFQSADGKKATLAGAQNQEGLQYMVDLMKDLGGWEALKTYKATWGGGAQDAFLVGQLGMMYQTNNWAGGVVAKYRPELKFGVAVPPVKKAGDKPLTWSGGFAYVMSAGVKDADTGWDLMKWLISEEGWTVAYEGNLARAKALGGVYLPGMTGQPDLDKRMFAKYKTGLPLVDKVPDVAVPLMQNSRVREPSLAAQNLWDGVKAAQREAISQAKTARQALDDNNALVQKALDDTWANVPK